MPDADWQFLTSAYYEQLRLEQQRDLLFSALPLGATVLNLVAALILFAAWRRHRNISQFDWLIGASLTGIGYPLNGVWPGLLAPFVGDTLLAAWLYFLSRLLYNYPSPTWQRWLGYLPLVAMLLYGAAEMASSSLLRAGVTGAYCLCLLVMSSHQVNVRLRRPLTSKLSLVLAVWLLALLGVVDSLIVATAYRLPAHPEQVLQLVPVGQIIGVFAALYFLVSRRLLPDQERPLADILADVRAEMQARCEQAGLTLHWLEDEVVGQMQLQARQEYALTCTLREALSNLLKHAQASEVWVCFNLVEGGVVEYTVADNGRGIDAAHRTGPGLVNMCNRMQELGGSIDIGARPAGGTRLHFLLPTTREVP